MPAQAAEALRLPAETPDGTRRRDDPLHPQPELTLVADAVAPDAPKERPVVRALYSASGRIEAIADNIDGRRRPSEFAKDKIEGGAERGRQAAYVIGEKALIARQTVADKVAIPFEAADRGKNAVKARFAAGKQKALNRRTARIEARRQRKTARQEASAGPMSSLSNLVSDVVIPGYNNTQSIAIPKSNPSPAREQRKATRLAARQERKVARQEKTVVSPRERVKYGKESARIILAGLKQAVVERKARRQAEYQATWINAAHQNQEWQNMTEEEKAEHRARQLKQKT